jgi:hypothetical protein
VFREVIHGLEGDSFFIASNAAELARSGRG